MRSDTGAGVAPAVWLPKLTVGRSSAMESTGWMSMSTPTLWETPAEGGGTTPQETSGLDVFRGVGTVGSVLGTNPKENIANQPLSFFISGGDKDPLLKDIKDGKQVPANVNPGIDTISKENLTAFWTKLKELQK